MRGLRPRRGDVICLVPSRALRGLAIFRAQRGWIDRRQRHARPGFSRQTPHPTKIGRRSRTTDAPFRPTRRRAKNASQHTPEMALRRPALRRDRWRHYWHRLCRQEDPTDRRADVSHRLCQRGDRPEQERRQAAQLSRRRGPLDRRCPECARSRAIHDRSEQARDRPFARQEGGRNGARRATVHLHSCADRLQAMESQQRWQRPADPRGGEDSARSREET